MPYALLSVSDKTGIVELARTLRAHNVTILSTGGTAQTLRDAGIAVTEVSEHTGQAEILGGRVKTLHPKIHGGILGRRGMDDAVLAEANIPVIDWVIVNLYPFQQTIAKPDCDLPTAIENIDIGGPAMLRAAAKNYASVTVIVDPNDYALITEKNAALTETQRLALAQKAFAHTASYDAAIATYLKDFCETPEFPETITLSLRKQQDLRYGENPHQCAAFYIEPTNKAASISTAQQLQGKELSYNNIADADTALECVRQFGNVPSCVIVKHANPCAVASATTQHEAYTRALAADSTSAFGGIVAFNTTVTADTMRDMLAQQFVEVLLAPDVTNEALALASEKKNLRVLRCGALTPAQKDWHCQRVTGGLLLQDRDIATITRDDLRVVTQRQPTDAEIADALFAWNVCHYVKSNAIVYAKNNQTLGIGAGQPSRIMSAKIAAEKAADAQLDLAGCAMASDAFFPFSDSIDMAKKVGATCIIQPGGSMRDAEVIAAADAAGIAMVFTGMRHFRH